MYASPRGGGTRARWLALAIVGSLALVTGATAAAVSPADRRGEVSKSKAFEVAPWQDEKKASWNAGIDAKIAPLPEKGIAARTTEIALGVRDIVWTDDLKTALGDLTDGKQ